MKKIIRSAGMLTVIAGVAASVYTPILNAAWPEKPISIVVPYRAGGITDLTARHMEPALEKVLQQEVVVFNNTGHSSVGTRRVIDATPNGYEFLWTETGIITTEAAGVTDFGYKDLKPVAAVSNICSVTMMQNKPGQSDLTDLFADAKKNDRVLIAGVSIGGLSHMSILALTNAADIKVRFVQIGGSADTYSALLGKQIDMSWATSGTAMKYTRDDNGKILDSVKVKAGLYSGPERFAGLPEVPTAHEKNMDVEVCMPHILFAPKNTPDALVSKMAVAVEDAYNSSEVQGFMGEIGATKFFLKGKELQTYLDSQWDLLSPLAQQATAKK